MTVAFEDSRLSLEEHSFASSIQDAIDDLDELVAQAVDKLGEDDTVTQNTSRENDSRVEDSSSHVSYHHSSSESDDDDLPIVPHFVCSDARDVTEKPPAPVTDSTTQPDADNQREPELGDRLEVYWPLDDRYYAGSVMDVKEDGRHLIHYDDDEDEELQLTDEVWRYERSANANQI